MAQEIWAELEARFSKESAPRIYELRCSIALLRQENLSVPAYYTKIKGFWDEVQFISPWPKCVCEGCKCDIQKRLTKIREREQLYDFLMGLDEVINTVKSQILGMMPNLSLEHAYHMVVEDEQQRLISATHKPITETTAFQTQNSKHGTDDCNKGNKKERPKCDHCQKIVHTQEECWEIVGYPQDWRKPNREKKGSWNSKKPGTRAAQVSSESPIPGLNKQQYDQLIQHLNMDLGASSGAFQAKTNVNAAGLTFKDGDWEG